MFIYRFSLILIIYFYGSVSYADFKDLTIEIDGSNLPVGEGSIKNGKKIFINQCSSCHGFSGEGLTAPELTGGSSYLNKGNISLTIGNYWPYAPKIFDYIRRAKRNESDSYFTDNEVYSLTGYLLNINGLYSKKKINSANLSNIKMPNSEGFISNY